MVSDEVKAMVIATKLYKEKGGRNEAIGYADRIIKTNEGENKSLFDAYEDLRQRGGHLSINWSAVEEKNAKIALYKIVKEILENADEEALKGYEAQTPKEAIFPKGNRRVYLPKVDCRVPTEEDVSASAAHLSVEKKEMKGTDLNQKGNRDEKMAHTCEQNKRKWWQSKKIRMFGIAVISATAGAIGMYLWPKDEPPTDDEILRAAYELDYMGAQDIADDCEMFCRRLMRADRLSEYLQLARGNEEVVERAKEL